MSKEEKKEVLTQDDYFVRGHYKQLGEEFEYIHAVDAMQCIHPYELINSIDFVDDYNYIIPSFTMTEIESRKHYQATFFLDPDNHDMDYHMDITPDNEEEGRIYRKIFKNPASGLWVFVQTGIPDDQNLNYEAIMVYEPSSEREMALKFTEALLNHYFNYKKYRTFKEVNVAVNAYRTHAEQQSQINPFQDIMNRDKK